MPEKNLNYGQTMALAEYHNRETLLQRYSQAKAPGEYEAIMGSSPTLAVMNSTFGAGTAEVIIASMLCGLNQYTNVKVKITPMQADAMATSIVADQFLQGIRGDVLVLFFERLKTGTYGELYNIIDAIAITSKLRQFFKDCETKRIAWADAAEMEEEYRRLDEHRKTAITFEQFKQTDAYKRIMQENDKINSESRM